MLIQSLFASFFVLGLVTIVSISAAPETVTSRIGLIIKSDNLIDGARVPGDRLLSQQNVIKNSSWMKVTSVHVEFRTPNNETISLVRATKAKTNETGAFAWIKTGGPGFRYVTVQFKSIPHHGIDFTLEIYGR